MARKTEPKRRSAEAPPADASRPQRIRTTADARAAMLNKLAGSGLDDRDAKKLGMRPYTAEESKSLGALPANYAGFRIPYFGTDGKETKFWRYRYLESTKSGFHALTSKKPLRYAQVGKSTNELYFCPLVDWRPAVSNSDTPIIITEGELKAACACKEGFYTIGLGGVWCFMSSKAHQPLLPEFDEFNWKGRPVYIVFDSDAISNPDVMQASNQLARKLSGLGAVCYVGKMPPAADGGKQGIDDYVMAGGNLDHVLDEAFEWRPAQELYALNGEVVYVRSPGIMLRRDNLQLMTPRAFVDHAYATRVYYEEQATDKGTKLVEKCAPKEWLKWPQRAEVAAITYAPGEGQITADNKFNMWPGWGCEPVAHSDVKLWHRLLDHLFAGAPATDRQWFERWLAYPLQHPGTKLFSAVLMWGKMTGTGKSLVGYIMRRIYGDNFNEIKEKHLHASHNEWAKDKQFIMADEITSGEDGRGKRIVNDALKTTITQETLTLNPKYIPAYSVRDCINWYFTSNHCDAFFMEDDDRRNFIHEVRSGKAPRELYAAIDHAMKTSKTLGPAVFAHLLSLDLGDFAPTGEAPMTDSKRDMMDLGRSDLGSWCAALRDSPDSVLRMDNFPMPFDLWRSDELRNLYDPADTKRVTANGMSRELRRAGFIRPLGTTGVRTAAGQFNIWAIRNADKYTKTTAKELGDLYDAERKSLAAASASKKARTKY